MRSAICGCRRSIFIDLDCESAIDAERCTVPIISAVRNNHGELGLRAKTKNIETSHAGRRISIDRRKSAPGQKAPSEDSNPDMHLGMVYVRRHSPLVDLHREGQIRTIIHLIPPISPSAHTHIRTQVRVRSCARVGMRDADAHARRRPRTPIERPHIPHLISRSIGQWDRGRARARRPRMVVARVRRRRRAKWEKVSK